MADTMAALLKIREGHPSRPLVLVAGRATLYAFCEERLGAVPDDWTPPTRVLDMEVILSEHDMDWIVTEDWR